MEYWSIGVLEYWSIGAESTNAPPLQHSTTPFGTYLPTPSIRFKESRIAWSRSLCLSWRFSKS